MIQYLDLLRHVMEHGKFKSDRTGTGTYSLFGAQARYPLADGFPLSPPRRFTPGPSSTSCSGFCAARRTSSISKTTA
jgi:thymidylate synthase